jgi:hypothetical protein
MAEIGLRPMDLGLGMIDRFRFISPRLRMRNN